MLSINFGFNQFRKGFLLAPQWEMTKTLFARNIICKENEHIFMDRLLTIAIFKQSHGRVAPQQGQQYPPILRG